MGRLGQAGLGNLQTHAGQHQEGGKQHKMGQALDGRQSQNGIDVQHHGGIRDATRCMASQ